MAILVFEHKKDMVDKLREEARCNSFAGQLMIKFENILILLKYFFSYFLLSKTR